MPLRPNQPTGPDESGPLDAILHGPIDPDTRHLLAAASGGDPTLLRALVHTGMSLGDLVRDDGRWRWGAPSSRTGRLASLIGHRAGNLAESQLAALRTLSEPWARPYAVVARAARDRPASGQAAPVPVL